jgi:hypothetical protein
MNMESRKAITIKNIVTDLFCFDEHLGHTLLYLTDKLENFFNVELKTLKNKGSIMG